MCKELIFPYKDNLQPMQTETLFNLYSKLWWNAADGLTLKLWMTPHWQAPGLVLNRRVNTTKHMWCRLHSNQVRSFIFITVRWTFEPGGWFCGEIYKEQKASLWDVKHLHRKLTDAPIWLFWACCIFQFQSYILTSNSQSSPPHPCRILNHGSWDI